MVKYLNWVNDRLTIQSAVADPYGAADAGKILALNDQAYVDPFAISDLTFQRPRAEYYTDFICGSSDGLTSTVSGAGAGNSFTAVTPPANTIGWVQHSTGTTATGRAAIGNINSVIRNTIENRLLFRGIFQIPLVSDALESYVYRCGFIDSNTGESTDGVFLRTTITGAAEFVCRSNNIETAAPLNFSFSLATDVYGISIEVLSNNSATLKLYRHDSFNMMAANSLVTSVTITTNIPFGASRLFGFGSFLIKTAGLNARIVNLDSIYIGSEKIQSWRL